MLDAGTESAAVSLTLTAATENNTASRPSAGRDRPGVPVLSDTVDPAAAVATVGGASDVAVVVILVLVVFHLAVGWKLVRQLSARSLPNLEAHRNGSESRAVAAQAVIVSDHR